jgi:enterochelin esterase-like enzyme
VDHLLAPLTNGIRPGGQPAARNRGYSAAYVRHALSAGVVPRRISGAARSAGVRHYLAAGTLEPGFRRSTREWAERLDRAGLACRHEEWTGGHDQLWWQQQLPVALGWLLQA